MGGPQRGEPAPGLGPLALPLGQLGLDPAAPGADRCQLLLDLLPLPLGLGGAALGGRHLASVGPDLGREQRCPQLVGLALEPGVDVGRLGLLLERAEAAPGLALDVERAVEVVLRALEAQLRAAAALAMLAKAGGVLDEQPPLRGLREHDLLDPALADHRVHLAPEVGVGEGLDHVREAAAGAVEAVLALARTIEAAADRDLGELGVRAARVEHDLDLRLLRGTDSLTAGVDHVLHRLAADGKRALFAEGPEDAVGDVGLAAAVRADDHADARRELQPGALGERFEPLDRDRAQMHGKGARGKARLPVGRDSAPGEGR